MALDYVYRYRQATALVEDQGALGLRLATFGGKEANPYFYEGQVRQPRCFADALLTLSTVVRTHFFLPRPALLDPVVTCADDILRLEGFSGCCGVYARVDLGSDTFDTRITGRGTTNVDFNTALRTGLTRLRQQTKARFAVGAESLALEVDGQEIVEKKVKLPIRWIKCFSEVQAYQPNLRLKLETTGPELLRFVRGIPRGGSKTQPAWVVPAGRGWRLSQRDSADGVRVAGTDRLRVLESLAASAKKVRAWSDDASGVSAWEVLFETGRFLLVLSPELYRGFSGEGQVLETLAHADWQEALSRVKAELAWQTFVDVPQVAERCKLKEEQVTAALAALGARGLVGYDLAEGQFFHRELPFDLEKVEALQPRLKDANKLLAGGKLKIHKRISDDQVEVLVPGTDVEHLVRLSPDEDRCTCPWYSKHQGDRGPCKHVLAARMFVEGQPDDA